MAPQVVQYPRATSLTAHSSRAVGVEVAAWAASLIAAPVGGGGAWPGFETAHHHAAPQAPLVWRVPEGPEGTGGLRDRPLRAAGSRVAISRAAGPDGAQNTSGAASNKLNREFRLCRRHGRLAGGPPPTGTPSSPAPQQDQTAPGTPAVPQAPPNGEASELLVVLRVLVGLAAVGAAQRADCRHLLRRQ